MADKKYDFSAFDKPASKQYDFSAFDNAARTPSSDDSGGVLDTLGDAARGVASGATFGFNDEIAGGLGAAGDTLMGNLPQDNNKTLLERIVDSYKQNRDETRQLDKRAAARSPYAYAGGTLAGGILPGLLTGETSEAATAAQAAEGLKNASVAGNILKGAGTGLGYGALAGLGNSEADTLSGNLNDAAEGAKTGALVGGALQGAIESAKGLGKLAKGVLDTDTADSAIKGFKEGTKGRQLFGKSGRDAANNLVDQTGEDLASAYREGLENAGQQVGEAKLAGKDLVYDRTATIEKLKNTIEKLKNTQGTPAQKSAVELQKVLDDTLSGVEKDIPIKYKVFSPSEEIPAISSAQEKLQLEAAKAKASADALGQKLNTSIIPSEDENGNKLLTLLKHSDENVGASERAIPIKDENGGIVGHDLDPGDGVNNKTSATAKTILDTPGQEAQTVPGKVTPVEKTVRGRTGGVDPSQMTGDQIQQLKAVLNQAGNMSIDGSALPDQTARNMSKVMAGELGDAVTHPAPGGIGPQTQLGAANSNYSDLIKALKNLGLSDEHFETNPLTGEEVLKPYAENKLGSLIIRSGRDGETQSGRNAANTLNYSLDKLKKVNPELGQQLEGKVSDASNLFDLMQKTQGLNLYNRSTFLKSGGALAGNALGLASSAVAKDVAPITNAVKNTAVNIGKSISQASPNEIKQVAQAVMTKGANGMKLASELAATLKKDNIGRNAALFAIQQNPGYREMLHEHTNDGQQK